MSDKFIFDVDGTLTPSRMMMNASFSDWFITFCENNDVYLVTGSDKKKTFGQIGGKIYDTVKRVYQCQGNDVWETDKVNTRTMTIKIRDEMQEMFDHFLAESKFPYRTGNHVEVRPGLINYSIVGRNATIEQRQEYVKWDVKVKERELIAEMFSQAFPDYSITVAGETGIDIVRSDMTKKQILKDFSDDDKLFFFGDSCQEGGNDYDIATRVAQLGGVVYNVEDWEHTWQLLKQM